MQQQAWSLDAVTLNKIAKSGLLLLAGGLLTFISDNLLQILAAIHLNSSESAYAVIVFTFLINAVREIIKGVPRNPPNPQ